MEDGGMEEGGMEEGNGRQRKPETGRMEERGERGERSIARLNLDRTWTEARASKQLSWSEGRVMNG
jgi:hypothetical protein